MHDVLIVYIVYFAICFVLSCIGCVDNWRGLQKNYISEYTIAIPMLMAGVIQLTIRKFPYDLKRSCIYYRLGLLDDVCAIKLDLF